MPGTLLFGIDVETASEDAAAFAGHGARLFSELQTPVTWYLTGKTLERYPRDFKALERNPLIDVQAHTYDHVLLKTVLIKVPKGAEVHGSRDWYLQRGGALHEIDEDLARCQKVFEAALGRRATALTGPWGYYRGLADRPDLLEIVDRHGFRALRTYARNADDGQPVDLETAPFFYAVQGFPHILECPVQFYQDEFYWRAFAMPPNEEPYLNALKEMVDEVAEKNLVGTVCSHDHAFASKEARAVKESWYRGVIEHARSRGVRFLTVSQFYEEMRNGTHGS
jgi:peptidoglycan/xylan/chitin deacetylase (PgdA/CDA1 family)